MFAQKLSVNVCAPELVVAVSCDEIIELGSGAVL